MDNIRLGNIMVDCADEEALCDFYHRLLGWEKLIAFGYSAVRSADGVLLLFCQDEGYVPPVWPEEAGRQQKQMHFDFQVKDVAGAVRQAQALGAVAAPQQFGGEAYVTMLDPAGHPFCLCSEDNPA